MNWKERRKLAYLMYEFDDVGLPHEYISCSDNELVEMTVKFFKTQSNLVYPAKSYFVAIVYAYYLQKHFSENFYTILDDERLLIDDKHFVPYSKSKSTYDRILKEIGCIEQYKSIKKTVQYFKQEFLIEG